MRALLTSALAAPAVLACACDARVTRAECTQMLDRYLDMVIAGDPALAMLSADEARSTRDARKAERKADPSFRKVELQCEAEISRREYRCAMKSFTPETWQACID
jgi:hypothetical protein